MEDKEVRTRVESVLIASDGTKLIKLVIDSGDEDVYITIARCQDADPLANALVGYVGDFVNNLIDILWNGQFKIQKNLVKQTPNQQEKKHCTYKRK